MESYRAIFCHMHQFLAGAEAEVVAARELHTGTFWSVFLPFVKLLYQPAKDKDDPCVSHCSNCDGAHHCLQKVVNNRQHSERHEPVKEQDEKEEEKEGSACVSMTVLQHLSVKSALFALKCMVLNKDNRSGLLSEGLNDYILCIPSHVPAQLRPQAEELVAALASHTRLQPPKLSSIAKAVLAKACYGLEHMIEMTSLQQLFNA